MNNQLLEAGEVARRVIELGEMMLRTAVDDRAPMCERLVEVERLSLVIRQRLRNLEMVIA